MTPDIYLEKVLGFTEKDVIVELEDICADLHVNPEMYLIFIHSGGISYTLHKIATDIYLSTRVIDDDIRQKLLLISIIIGTDINFRTLFRVNEDLEQYKKGSWDYEKTEKSKANIVEKIKENIGRAYRNCFTCADMKSGCRGEDHECCSPNYKDWRDK